MFLDKISKSQSYTTKLIIQKPTILHIIPDFNIDIVDSVLHMNLGINNCQSIYVKTSPLKFGAKQLNPKLYFYKLKDHKDIPATLVQSLPSKISDNHYIIADHSMLSQGIQQLLEINKNPKYCAQLLFEKLKEDFLTTKSKFPKAENVILFDLNMMNDGLLEVIQSLKQMADDRDLLKCFDNFVLVAVSAEIQKTTFIPLLTYDEKGNIEILTNNIPKITEAVAHITPIEITPPSDSGSPPINAEDKLKAELAEKVSQTVVHSAEKTQDSQLYTATIELDKAKLAKALNGFQIKDPVVSNNIKVVIDQYLKTHPNAAKTDLEQLILQAIHFSLFNDETLSDEYKADPNKLISKLTEMNTYVKEITYPEVVHNPQMVSPGDIISLHRVTGVGRHKYELGQNLDFNVKNLFKSLETRKVNPIKVLKIKSTLLDNNLDRVREYTVTVKNNNGLKEPYDLKLRIPALVNDYYFKLNGQNYVLNNQQYLKPITKDKDSEVRFLSHYNMITLKVVNSKFSTSQINDILNFIRVKYSTGCSDIEIDESTGNVTKMTFKDGSVCEPGSHTPYSSNNKEVTFDDGEYKLHDINTDTFMDLHIPKNEYIFHELLLQIQKVNPEEKLNRTAKTIPFIQAHLMGRQLPLIFFLWQQIGLIETLVRYNIDHEIGNHPTLDRKSSIEIPVGKGRNLYMYPTNKRQELLVNGLLQLPKDFTLKETDLSSRNSLNDFLNTKYGNRTSFNFDLMMDNVIDPTTKDLLEFEDKPTNFIDLLNGPMMDKLLNDPPDHPADLKNLRLRQSEVLTNLLYSELCMALNKYNTDLANGIPDAKLYFHPDYIIMNLLGRHAHSGGDDSAGGVMDYNTTFSPVDELLKASKLIKTGPGGVPSKRAFRKEHRAIHESYIGNVSSHSISEYASVGIVNTLTLGASISNNYGGFGGKRANYTPDNIDSLGIDEYLTPFCGHLDSERLVIARTHTAQKVPILEGELPLVETGAEYLIPQLTSTKFAHNAKMAGKVLAVSPDEFITIQYENGKIENLDIMPRYTATKRNSTIQISLDNLEVGASFQKGQLIAWSKAFNGDGLVIGRNTMMAVMNYRGYSFEDAYVVSEDMSSKFVSENVIRVPIIIPTGTKVLSIINSKGIQTDSTTPLIEFQYMKSIDEYISNYELLSDEFNEDQDSLFAKGTNTLKRMSPGGEIVNIKIKLNTKNGVDPLLVNLWETQKKNINILEKNLTKYATTEEEGLVDNIDMSVLKVGGHKVRAKEFDGVLVEYYVKQAMPIEIGNKIANRYGAKGCVGYIIPKDKIPKGEYTDHIDIFIQPSGVLGRKNTSILKEMYSGKIIYFLPKIISEKLQNGMKLEEAKKLILSVYELISDERCSASIIKKFDAITDKVLTDSLIHQAIRFNLTIPPFTSPTFSNLKKAAELLGIPLNERVYMPEIGEWTKDAVPVGIQYYSTMEQLSSDYESTRSTAGYVSATGQPTVKSSGTLYKVKNLFNC